MSPIKHCVEGEKSAKARMWSLERSRYDSSLPSIKGFLQIQKVIWLHQHKTCVGRSSPGPLIDSIGLCLLLCNFKVNILQRNT